MGFRHFMESVAMLLIAILVLVTNFRSGNVVDLLPILGALVLGAQRSLPLSRQSMEVGLQC